ncbi:polysaccharide pyruvyl transferase family protein [Tritonibacter aquimaris]|nr:polysaccharide pyruvyl transferase family protein [Tritonibacter aquimaris]
MDPFYYTTSTNFGDHMNSWLWPTLIPEMLEREDDVRLIGVGSLLSRNLDLVAGRKVIFGTGSGYSSLPEVEQARHWKIYCVRGPLTANLMGLDPALAITDGAWLINQIPKFATLPTERKGTVFVPHWTSAKFGNWSPVCSEADVKLVDPLWDCERVFSDIAHAELALVESLHGAIIADYYRTPWVPVVSPSRILKFKWLDWCGSLGLEYSPYSLPPSDYVDCLLQRSSARRLNYALQQIDVPQNTFDVRQTPPPPTSAGPIYFAKNRVKKHLRNTRNYGLEKLADLRDGAMFSTWNRRHRAKLVQYFTELKSVRPQLSQDSVRKDRIDGLNAALEEMRSDFQAGKI